LRRVCAPPKGGALLNAIYATYANPTHSLRKPYAKPTQTLRTIYAGFTHTKKFFTQFTQMEKTQWNQ